jgi:hypothetical protein
MKNLPLFLIIATTVLLRISGAELAANLQPLAPLLGDWKLEANGPDGTRMSGHASLKPDANGAVIIFKSEIVGDDGSIQLSRVSVFYWDATAHALAESNFDSNGWYGSNLLSKTSGNKMTWKAEAHSPDGKRGTHTTEIVKIDKNNWTAQFVNQVLDGQTFPDTAKFKFSRGK